MFNFTLERGDILEKIFQEKVFKVPYFLFTDKYKKLSMNSKMLYGVLFTCLINKFQKVEDENGDSSSFRDKAGIFVDVQISRLASVLCLKENSVYNLLTFLEIAGLIARVSDSGNIRVYFKM